MSTVTYWWFKWQMSVLNHSKAIPRTYSGVGILCGEWFLEGRWRKGRHQTSSGDSSHELELKSPRTRQRSGTIWLGKRRQWRGSEQRLGPRSLDSLRWRLGVANCGYEDPGRWKDIVEDMFKAGISTLPWFVWSFWTLRIQLRYWDWLVLGGACL